MVQIVELGLTRLNTLQDLLSKSDCVTFYCSLNDQTIKIL